MRAEQGREEREACLAVGVLLGAVRAGSVGPAGAPHRTPFKLTGSRGGRWLRAFGC